MESVETTAHPGRIRRILSDILGTHATPSRTAASLAIGVAIGLSPFLGLHTLLVIIVAFILGLNRIAALTGSCIFNPWSAVPIVLLQLKMGGHLLNRDQLPLPDLPSLFQLSDFLAALYPRLIDYLVGGLLLAAVGGILSYPPCYYVVRYLRTHHFPLIHRHGADGR